MKRLRRGVILAYHGFMGSPRKFLQHSKLDVLAESIDFEIEFMHSAGGVWYWGGEGDWARFMHQRQADQMREAMAAYKAANLPRVLVGFSAGGNMVVHLATEFPEEVSAVFAAGAEWRVTNWCPPIEGELPPAIFEGNANDPRVPPEENGERLAPWWGATARFERGPDGDDPVWGGHSWIPEFNNPLLAELIAGLSREASCDSRNAIGHTP